MVAQLENGKEWAQRIAENVARELGIEGKLAWVAARNGKLSLIIRSAASSNEVLAFDESQLRRLTYDFGLQYSTEAEIRSAVMDVHLRE